jgi:putative ABC transport system substrate-binding protein
MLSYGVDLSENYRRAAELVHKILNGAKAGDLPVEFPTKLYLGVNQRTAKTIGVTIPESFLIRADEVIE